MKLDLQQEMRISSKKCLKGNDGSIWKCTNVVGVGDAERDAGKSPEYPTIYMIHQNGMQFLSTRYTHSLIYDSTLKTNNNHSEVIIVNNTYKKQCTLL